MYIYAIYIILYMYIIVLTSDWNYSGEKGWEGGFLPLSDTCTSAEGAVLWSADHSIHQVCIQCLV